MPHFIGIEPGVTRIIDIHALIIALRAIRMAFLAHRRMDIV
jgi:hypothetical protein